MNPMTCILDDVSKIGGKIRKLRQLREMSQEGLGSEVGLTQAQISKIERDESDVDTELLIRIAKVFDVAPAMFFEKDDSRLFQSEPSVHFSGDPSASLANMLRYFSQLNEENQELAVKLIQSILEAQKNASGRTFPR